MHHAYGAQFEYLNVVDKDVLDYSTGLTRDRGQTQPAAAQQPRERGPDHGPGRREVRAQHGPADRAGRGRASLLPLGPDPVADLLQRPAGPRQDIPADP